jgi:hypothetical protein
MVSVIVFFDWSDLTGKLEVLLHDATSSPGIIHRLGFARNLARTAPQRTSTPHLFNRISTDRRGYEHSHIHTIVAAEDPIKLNFAAYYIQFDKSEYNIEIKNDIAIASARKMP